jgi:hypothetical protein
MVDKALVMETLVAFAESFEEVDTKGTCGLLGLETGIVLALTHPTEALTLLQEYRKAMAEDYASTAEMRASLDEIGTAVKVLLTAVPHTHAHDIPPVHNIDGMN